MLGWHLSRAPLALDRAQAGTSLPLISALGTFGLGGKQRRSGHGGATIRVILSPPGVWPLAWGPENSPCEAKKAEGPAGPRACSAAPGPQKPFVTVTCSCRHLGAFSGIDRTSEPSVKLRPRGCLIRKA